MVYLTPDAPLNSGTATYRSKITGATRFDNYDDKEETITEITNKDLSVYTGTYVKVVVINKII